jgi:soluble lytic murein transglycosylase-like protein
VRALCAAVVLTVSVPSARSNPDVAILAALPLPPVIDRLIALPSTFQKGRAAHLPLIKAKRAGLLAAIADAVVNTESRFNPTAIGGVGEVGLMQIRRRRPPCLVTREG